MNKCNDDAATGHIQEVQQVEYNRFLNAIFIKPSNLIVIFKIIQGFCVIEVSIRHRQNIDLYKKENCEDS